MNHIDFLQAIRADPDSDAPRLIYADWLEEQGDSERAEFIRLQCQIDNLSAADPVRLDAKVRAQRLLVKNEKTWLGFVTLWTERRRWERGMLEYVSMQAKAFITAGESLFPAVTVRKLSLEGINEATASVFKSPRLADLMGLALHRDHELDEAQDTGKTLAALLASCPYLAKLKILLLDGFGLGNEGVKELVASTGLRSLRVLSLKSNEITAAGARHLAQSTAFPHLTSLDLGYHNIPKRELAALRKKYGANAIKHFDLPLHLA